MSIRPGWRRSAESSTWRSRSRSEQFDAAKKKLDEAGVDYLGPDRGVLDSMYFRDPNGVGLELYREELGIFNGHQILPSASDSSELSPPVDVGNIAELNTFLVLDAVRSHGRVTRSQLARELGLSDASVSRIVKRLLSSGIVDELPGEPAARGRTPSIVSSSARSAP